MFKSSIIFSIVIIGLIANTKQDGLNIMIADETPVEEVDNMKSADELCLELNCGLGEQCVFDEDQPRCACFEECDVPEDERLKICTTSNQTYDSECHFEREKCWCARDDNKCSNPSVLSETLDYFGSCQYIGSCTEEQKKVFPSRIKIWLDEILFTLNERKDLDVKYGHLVSLASQMKKDNVEKYWTCGVAFEFCQLDKSHDGIIEFEEMKALIAPIKALETCIQPFLEECDSNNDGQLSDTEWAHCLDLSEDDLTLLRSVCKP